MRWEILLIAVISLPLLGIALFIRKRIPKKRLRTPNFTKKWRQVQSMCGDKQKWPEAIVAADKLLNQALKKRRFKGKRMGERMVSAQNHFTNNDAVWSAHNFAKKILADPAAVKLKENEVKEVLISFRNALKDLGAIKDGQSGNS